MISVTRFLLSWKGSSGTGGSLSASDPVFNSYGVILFVT